jgi:GNAT superfamily N-acetyltransferase
LVKESSVQIRPVRADDAERVAVLCGQLGYPASREAVERRLHQIRRDEQHGVWVAESPDGTVVGWVHGYVCRSVAEDAQVEIGGLVVDERHRRRGVGRLLVEHVERWARERDCWAVHVRSNVIREDARAFYESIGYALVKAQRVFRRPL